MTTIISSVYGDYDQPEFTPQSVPVDCVMVTDGLTEIPEGWSTVIEPRPHMHPRLAAKVAKCRPDLYTSDDITIWVDASIVLRPRFAEWVLDELDEHGLAQLPHPVRQSIVDEAEVSAGMEKYANQAVLAQATYYVQQRSHPPAWGMWATGIIARRRSTVNSTLGARWLAEQVRWTYQDQISQPFVLHDMGVRPHDLTGPLWHHPHFTVRGHRSDA